MRQVMVPAALQGRVTAAARTIGMSVTPIGGIIGGVLAGVLTPSWALVIAGVVGVSSALPVLSPRLLAIRV